MPRARAVFYRLWSLWPTQNDLGYVATESCGFDPRRFYDNNPLADWPRGITVRVRRDEPVDYIKGDLNWVLFSHRARQVFLDLGIDGVEFLPLKTLLDGPNKEIGPYWVVHVMREVEALDCAKTIWADVPTGNVDHPLLFTLNEAFRWDAVRGCDVFRLRKGSDKGASIYLSSYVVRELRARGASCGFRYTRVPAN